MGSYSRLKFPPNGLPAPTVATGGSGQGLQKRAATKEKPPGAVVAGIAGLVVSIDVKVGDHIQKGDQLAVIEAMKMMRTFLAPHSGIVKEICIAKK